MRITHPYMKNTLLFLLLCCCVAGLVMAGGQRGRRGDSPSGGSFDWVLPGDGFPEVDALAVRGDIVTAGSSTVFPLVEALATRFGDEGYGDTISIDSIGSGAGFERFCGTGETDIATASRPIRERERENCAAIGRTPIEFAIGVDALAVVVNADNSWIEDASIAQLVELFSRERWGDVGGGWPNEPILRFVPGADSGTFDYFVEEVFDDDGAMLLSVPGIQFSEDDNILAQGVISNSAAIGFFGFAYYIEQAERLKLLKIEGIEAVPQNVYSGTYPLSRPLFLYSDAEIMRTRPQVAAYLAFVLNWVNEEVGRVGYFAINDDSLQAGRARWLEAMEGTFGSSVTDSLN